MFNVWGDNEGGIGWNDEAEIDTCKIFVHNIICLYSTSIN